MDIILQVRIPNELAARLAAHKKRTLIPTSAFVRRAIEYALDPEDGLDSADALTRALEEEERRNEALFHGEKV